MESYNHRQTSTLMLIGGVASTAIVLWAAWTAPEFPSWLSVVLIIILITIFGQFSSLSAIVTDKAVIAQFGSGYLRRSIPLERIKSVKSVRNSWLAGWGIRLIPGGWMFNVAGFDAVELELTSGSRFRIGTDEPGRLEAAILQAMSVTGRNG